MWKMRFFLARFIIACSSAQSFPYNKKVIPALCSFLSKVRSLCLRATLVFVIAVFLRRSAASPSYRRVGPLRFWAHPAIQAGRPAGRSAGTFKIAIDATASQVDSSRRTEVDCNNLASRETHGKPSSTQVLSEFCVGGGGPDNKFLWARSENTTQDKVLLPTFSFLLGFLFRLCFLLLPLPLLLHLAPAVAEFQLFPSAFLQLQRVLTDWEETASLNLSFSQSSW